MIETWKGEYQGFIKKTGSSGKPYFSHKVKKPDGTESFTSFGVPDALENAVGQQVSIPIIRSEEGYCNLDTSKQVEVEAPTIKEAKEKPTIQYSFNMNPEEGLRDCLRIAGSLMNEAIPADSQMTAYERADLIIRLAITMWIQKR